MENARYLARLENRTRIRIYRLFTKQITYLLEAIKDLSAFQTNSPEDEIEKMLSGLPGQQELAEEIYATGLKTSSKGGKYIISELKLAQFGITYSQASPAVLKYLGGRLSAELSDYRGNITGTTKMNISKIILKAVQEGQSYQKTAEQIMEQGKSGVFSQARAQMIAVRESRVAYDKGKRSVVKHFQNKFPEETIRKYWQTVEDNKVTDTHRMNQRDGWVDMDHIFTGTGDISAPGSDNPRCRCTMRYRIS